ncbi:MAG: protein-methionine-sulfoxide reductase catalytic subunit MsrP, partial [Gammaproteobacteria bacterium]
MLIKNPDPIRPSEITDERLYLARRSFLKAAGLGTAAVGGAALTGAAFGLAFEEEATTAPLSNIETGPF